MPRTKRGAQNAPPPTIAPPTAPAHLMAAFAAPQKKARASVQLEKQRDRYRQDIIAQGIPPKLAKLIVDKHGTPKQINPIVQGYTGKCALTNIPLSDIGDEPSAVIYQTKPAPRFISNIAYKTILYSKLGEKQFIQFCKLIVSQQNAQSTTPPMGHASVHQHVIQHTARSGRTADAGDSKRPNFLGLR